MQAKGSQKYNNSHHVEFSILDENGKKFGIHHMHSPIPIDLGFQEFIRLADLENPANNLLPNNTLTICCRVQDTKELEKEEDNQIDQIEELQTKRARLQLGQDLASLLDDKSADFIFKVENEKIQAHRAILKARSPVFAAMFQHEMEENKTNEAEIEDVTPAAFRAFLRFIYTGHCEVGNLAEELLVAAKKYDIRELKEICAKEMVKQLTVDNAVRFLVLSDLHQAEDLKNGAMHFINKNAPAVMKTPSWSALTKNHYHLMGELYSKLCESKGM